MSTPIVVPQESYARASAALWQSEFTTASIPARTAFIVGWLNASEGQDQRAELETSEDLAAYDAGFAAGTTAREAAA